MTITGVPNTYWEALAEAADRGQLYLNPEAAKACDAACDSYVARLIEHQERAADLAEADGWGEFSAGQQLREVFARKAVGGENNMVDVLQSHIDVVKEMQTVFRKFFVATEAVDEHSATDIGVQGTP